MAWRGWEGARPPSVFLSGNVVRDPAFLPLGLWVTNAVKARVRSAWLGLPLPSLPCLARPGWTRFWGLSLSHPSLQHRRGNGHADCGPAVLWQGVTQQWWVVKEGHLHVSVWMGLRSLWLDNPLLDCPLYTLRTGEFFRTRGLDCVWFW